MKKKGSTPVLPYKNHFRAGDTPGPVKVVIENTRDCQRYSGVYISGLTVTDSPKWLKQKLQSIGVKSINNIVDITNFILHESGQPLHAFDADKILGNLVRIGNMPEGAVFKTLDDKERKLTGEDLMICNEREAMCIAGVYGGIDSGVTAGTTNIFLESAWFHPKSIRKTSVHHGLRTDAATRFEKGVDISNTVTVLKRAAELIADICGGQIARDIIDVYPQPATPVSVGLKYHYLKKLSGKNYHGDTIKNILAALGFEIQKEGMDELWVKVPTSKPDITLPADIVEEIMRIDGLDNIEIPATITIAPSGIDRADNSGLQEKLANQLTGLGFSEIFTNSITNSNYYDQEALYPAVRMINNLSIELDIMRPTMLPTGLEVVAHNINRKNGNLLFFENGKTYAVANEGKYKEQKHLSLFATGNVRHASWNQAEAKADYYFLKSICEKVLGSCGIVGAVFNGQQDANFEQAAVITSQGQVIGQVGSVSERMLKRFGIRQPVIYADLLWEPILNLRKMTGFTYAEVGKFPTVQRDLAFVVNKAVTYAQLQDIVGQLKVPQLQAVSLFDVFESEKLGTNKKSMAVSFTFIDNSKTLVDAEVDEIMNRIIGTCEKTLQAEIRK